MAWGRGYGSTKSMQVIALSSIRPQHLEARPAIGEATVSIPDSLASLADSFSYGGCGPRDYSIIDTIMEARSDRPPEVDSKTAEALIAKHFPFRRISVGSLRSLPSYYDRNIYFEGLQEKRDGSSNLQEEEGFVLKVSSRGTTPEIIDGLNSQMLFLSGKGFPCCYPIASRGGEYTALASESELLGVAEGDVRQVDVLSRDVKYPVRVMKYIAGDIMDKLDERYLSPELSYSVGKMAGGMDLLLQVCLFICS